jgi:AcrR family transcriptional regulator
LRTRDDILRAARAIVLEAGVDALSLRAVAAKADFSPAALYEYFEGKDAIVRALSEQTMMRLGKHLERAAKVASPARRLVAIGLAYIDFALTHEEDFLLAFTRFRSSRRAASEPISEASPYGVLAAAVESAVAQGVVERPRGVPMDTLAYAVWSHAHGIAMLRLTHLRGFQADFKSADGRALGALIVGMGPRPKRRRKKVPS